MKCWNLLQCISFFSFISHNFKSFFILFSCAQWFRWISDKVLLIFFQDIPLFRFVMLMGIEENRENLMRHIWSGFSSFPYILYTSTMWLRHYNFTCDYVELELELLRFIKCILHMHLCFMHRIDSISPTVFSVSPLLFGFGKNLLCKKLRWLPFVAYSVVFPFLEIVFHFEYHSPRVFEIIFFLSIQMSTIEDSRYWYGFFYSVGGRKTQLWKRHKTYPIEKPF